MQKEKYCPKCLKLVDGKTSKCPQCGYEFVEVIEEDEVTNATQLHDPVPAIVWKASCSSDRMESNRIYLPNSWINFIFNLEK